MNAGCRTDKESMYAWRTVRNLLAIRLDNVGDLLMTTPALAAVRHTLPEARITLLASPAGVEAGRHVPGIDDFISYQAPWMKTGNDDSLATLGLRTLDLAAQLAEKHFDAAIIFTVCTQSALPAAMLCMLAGIPLRLAHSRENPYALLSEWVPDTDIVSEGMRHEVDRQLALVAAVGMHTPDERLQFRVEADEIKRLRERLTAHGVAADTPYFVVHVGASAPSRRYPALLFGQAVSQITEHSGCLAIFTGDAGEISLVEEARLATGGTSLSLAGQLSLGELGALIGGARILLSNNTGPVHIAAALHKPVVALYALTNPQHMPWKVPAQVLSHDVPCRNCLKSICPEGHHACLRGISPQRVADACLHLMDIHYQQPALEPVVHWMLPGIQPLRFHH